MWPGGDSGYVQKVPTCPSLPGFQVALLFTSHISSESTFFRIYQELLAPSPAQAMVAPDLGSPCVCPHCSSLSPTLLSRSPRAGKPARVIQLQIHQSP